MLRSRRVLEMGNRVHWYLVFSTISILLFYIACLSFETSNQYCAVLSEVLKLFIFLTLVFGVWIFIFCISLLIRDRIFPVKHFIGNIFRVALIIGVDVTFSMVYELAGNSITIL